MRHTARRRFVVPPDPGNVVWALRAISRQVFEDVYSDLPKDATWHDFAEVVLHQVEIPLSEYRDNPRYTDAIKYITDWQSVHHDWAMREISKWAKEQSDRRGRMRG